MDKKIYENLINELVELNRPDFEIEEVGYFWNELMILKREKMPMENIMEEINKFQRIVINNDLSAEDEEEMFEDLSRKQQKPAELLSYLKEESFYTKEDLANVETNIKLVLEAKDAETLSEFEMYKFNADEYQRELEEEKKEIGYVTFDYVSFLGERIEKYTPEA